MVLKHQQMSSDEWIVIWCLGEPTNEVKKKLHVQQSCSCQSITNNTLFFYPKKREKNIANVDMNMKCSRKGKFKVNWHNDIFFIWMKYYSKNLMDNEFWLKVSNQKFWCYEVSDPHPPKRGQSTSQVVLANIWNNKTNSNHQSTWKSHYQKIF